MKTISYELSLHHHIKVLIRLEQMLLNFEIQIQQLTPNSMHLALLNTNQIIELIETQDVKLHLVKEVERLTSKLLAWQDNPNIDNKTLVNTIEQLKKIEKNINKSPDVGIVKENNFLKEFNKQLKQNAGLSMLDFPRFNFRLNSNLSPVQITLLEWSEVFKAYLQSTSLVLKIIRGTSFTNEQIAKEGYYQESLDKSIEYLLIRVHMPMGVPCYPEITGGIYHITIRMLKDDWNYGTSTFKKNVRFMLSKCHK